MGRIEQLSTKENLLVAIFGIYEKQKYVTWGEAQSQDLENPPMPPMGWEAADKQVLLSGVQFDYHKQLPSFVLKACIMLPEDDIAFSVDWTTAGDEDGFDDDFIAPYIAKFLNIADNYARDDQSDAGQLVPEMATVGS